MNLGAHTGPFAKMAGLMGAVSPFLQTGALSRLMQGALPLAALLLVPLPLVAQVDISNPQRLMFVADAVDPVIDVIDLVENEVVFRIETEERVDDMVATPFAPVLIYTNMEKRLVSMYDLRNKTVAKQVELPIVPRHMVLDTTGSKIGFSDSEAGGFVLFSAYGGQILFALEDHPPTSDVLFDPNEVDIWYSNSRDGTIGLIDSNVHRTYEIPVADEPGQLLSSPSRSSGRALCLRRQRDDGRSLRSQCVLQGHLQDVRNRCCAGAPLYDA